MRLISNLEVWRPADIAEIAVAWVVVLRDASRSSALLFSWQNLLVLSSSVFGDVARGAYVLAEAAGCARAVIIATGSEVQLALHAQAALARDGIAVRVVSMPSTTVFDRQSVDYKSAVLPPKLPRIAVEAGVTDGWWKYGCAAVVGLDRYGESAPGPQLFKHFKLTAENVADVVRTVLGR